MTFRVTPSNVLDVVRSMVDDIDLLKRQTGSVKQNTIRLGDWVLEAVDDSLVKMTNLVTGEESYIGGVGDGGGTVDVTVVPEFPPFVISGVIRQSFGTTIKTNAYVVPYSMTIGRVVATIAITSASAGVGPFFRIYQNGVVVYTSTEVEGNYYEDTANLTFAAGDIVFMECHNDGNGDSIGLTVMLRSSALG